MPSAKQKGNLYEIEAVEVMQSQGYLVHRVGRKARYIGFGKMITVGDDIFGCDLIGINQKGIKFVQVCTIGNIRCRARKIPMDQFPHNFCSVEIWGRTSGRGRHFRVYAGKNFIWNGICHAIKKEQKNEKNRKSM